MDYYGDGTSMACRIDPADSQRLAFAEKLKAASVGHGDVV